MSCHSILDFYDTCLGNIFKRATGVLRNVSKLSFIKGYITMTRNVILVLSRDFSSRTDTLSTGFSHVAAHVVLYLCYIKILLMDIYTIGNAVYYMINVHPRDKRRAYRHQYILTYVRSDKSLNI